LSKVSLPISEVDVSCFAHATEDENKVLTALKHIFPQEYVDSIIFTKTTAKGHHGNPIVVFETKIKDKIIVKAVVETLASGLSPLDKETLLNAVDRHVEKGSFYLRLDKQAAFEGEFTLALADPIRVRLRFKKSRFEDVVEIGREIGMLPR
jgi:hypothetical protein